MHGVLDVVYDWLHHYDGCTNKLVGLNARADDESLHIVGIRTARESGYQCDS